MLTIFFNKFAKTRRAPIIPIFWLFSPIFENCEKFLPAGRSGFEWKAGNQFVLVAVVNRVFCRMYRLQAPIAARTFLVYVTIRFKITQGFLTLAFLTQFFNPLGFLNPFFNPRVFQHSLRKSFNKNKPKTALTFRTNNLVGAFGHKIKLINLSEMSFPLLEAVDNSLMRQIELQVEVTIE